MIYGTILPLRYGERWLLVIFRMSWNVVKWMSACGGVSGARAMPIVLDFDEGSTDRVSGNGSRAFA